MQNIFRGQRDSLRKRLSVDITAFRKILCISIAPKWLPLTRGKDLSNDSPISVPTPSTLPPKLIKALSPPDEPPLVSFLLRGDTVRPNVLFTDSAIIIAADGSASLFW
jgi:hypothetical protein